MDGSSEIFRRQAVEHHASLTQGKGALLRLSPSWIDWTYPLVLAFACIALVYLVCGRLNTYASGPAIVRISRRIDISSPTAEVVGAITVAPGQRVRAGELLVQMESTEKDAEMARVTRDFEDALADHLRDPLDDVSRRNVASLRVEKEFAERMLETKRLRSPRDAIVEGVRVRAGQPLSPGQIVLTLRSGDPVPQIVGVLPGRHLPLLREGLRAWIQLDGYANVNQRVNLKQIGSEVVGPSEARRFLGADVADAVALAGPVVVVEGSMPSDVFRVDGLSYDIRDGMLGRLEVQVRAEPVILALVPGLRYFIEHRHE